MSQPVTYEVTFTNRKFPNIAVSAYVSPLREDEKFDLARAKLHGIVSADFMVGAGATVSIAPRYDR